MKHSYTQTFRRVLLRPLEERDIEELRVLRNKNQQYFNNTAQITPEQQKVWYEKYLTKEDDYMFAAELVDNPGVFIGSSAIYNIDWETGTLETGRLIIDKENNPEKGIGAEVGCAHSLIAFAQMELKRIVGDVRKDNPRALKMNLNLGYTVIGETEDHWILQLKREDFLKTIEFLNQG